MFEVSASYNWEGDESVRQSLVFPSKVARDLFHEKFQRQEITTISSEGKYKDENGLGAIYKLRAVKNSDDKWLPVIRCGFTGQELYQGTPQDTWQLAMNDAEDYLFKSIDQVRGTRYIARPKK